MCVHLLYWSMNVEENALRWTFRLRVQSHELVWHLFAGSNMYVCTYAIDKLYINSYMYIHTYTNMRI